MHAHGLQSMTKHNVDAQSTDIEGTGSRVTELVVCFLHQIF